MQVNAGASDDNQPAATLMLFDGHALIYRAYHAFPPLTTPDGSLANAVYGFTRILLTLLEKHKPDFVAVAFDHKGKTFRHQEFAEYKANRVAMPDDLIPQIGWVRELVNTLNIPNFSLEGYEADDLIGTLAKQAGELSQAVHTTIVTGDRDLLQLVDETTTVLLPGKSSEQTAELTREAVHVKYGVWPEQLPELKALMGDVSDNIPGVKGIGPKTAAKLMIGLGGLAEIVAAAALPAAERPPTAGVRQGHWEAIAAAASFLHRNLRLTTIDTQVPIKLELENCRLAGYNKQEVIELFDKMGFQSLKKYLPADDFEVGLQEALL